MRLNVNELIHTQVTNTPVDIVDDGRGNYNISPIGFPCVDRSGFGNPTLMLPSFGIASVNAVTVSVNVDELSGLGAYSDGQVLDLVAQVDESENGRYIVRSGTWDRYVEYKYDGTEGDNKAGLYDGVDKVGNQLNHYRRGYSHSEVAGYLREKLAPSIGFGRFVGMDKTNGNGGLVDWFTKSGKVNLGGSTDDKSVYVDSFASCIGVVGGERKYYPGNPEDAEYKDYVVDLHKRESRHANWSLSNHHSEAVVGRNKSPFVRDYPFKYNSSYTGDIFTGGMPPLESMLDDWRIRYDGVSETFMRPFCDEMLYYQRDNGYHNNITIDMSAPNMVGRQHISILHHLDRSDVAANDPTVVGDGTTYVAYTNNLVSADLDSVAGKSISGNVFLYKATNGTVSKYYYKQREKHSVTLVPVGSGVLSDDTLLWEADSGYVRVHITSGVYVTYANGSNSVDWMVAMLSEYNQLIPCVFTLPVDPVESVEYLDTLDVLFIDNSLVDTSNAVHKSERIRSKKTFIHLPTSVDLVDGQQFELDVSLPMITDQEPFKYNTLGSVSGYMNYITQPRVYVFGGVQSCYGSNNYIARRLTVNSATMLNGVVTVKSFAHGITDVDIKLNIVGSGYYTGIKAGVVIDPDTLSFPVSALAGAVPSGLLIYRLVRITDVVVGSFGVVDGVARLVTVGQHGLLAGESVLVTVGNSVNPKFNGKFRAYVVDDKTFVLYMDGVTGDSGGSSRILGIIVAHAEDVVSDSYIALPDLVGIDVVGSLARAVYSSRINVMPNTSITYTLSGCNPAVVNGRYSATVVDSRTIEFTISGSYTGKVTGNIVSGASIVGDGLVSSRGGVAGLTERGNDYMYSVMPEVEYATSGNVYHQRKMGIGDIQASDKRVLLATVYPTSTNTFAWRIDNDPQHRMLRQSILANASVYGSGAYCGYAANKRAYDSIAPALGGSTMNLYDTPVSYADDMTVGDVGSFHQFIASRVRVLMPESNTPNAEQILSKGEASTVGSLVHQMKTAYNEFLDTYYSTRVGGSLIGIGLASIGYDGNSGCGDDAVVGSGFASIMRFDTLGSTTRNNQARWLTKAIYTTDMSMELGGVVGDVAGDVYSVATTGYVGYLRRNSVFMDVMGSNSDTRYIPGQLNSPASSIYRFGVGYRNPIAAFLDNIGAAKSIKNDFAMSLSDWHSVIPDSVMESRDITKRFVLRSGRYDGESMAAFYGMNSVPVARVFSGDGLVPVSGKLGSLVNFTDIMGGVLKDTLMGSISSNPLLGAYAESMRSDVPYVSMNTRSNNSAIQEFLRNHIVGYANRSPIRFYNSFRICLVGDTQSTDSTEYSVIRAYESSISDYVAGYIDVLPSTLYGRYVDDNIALINSDIPTVQARDLNDSTMCFGGRGESAVAKITVSDWSELLDGGNATVVINGVVFSAIPVGSEPGANQFVAGIGDVETATSLVSQINKNMESGVLHISADNYAGMSNIVVLTVSDSVGSVGNTYSLVFNPSSAGNGGIEIIGFGGGSDAVSDKPNLLIGVSGNQYIASKDFYTRNMRHSYIRVHMRFIFSSDCGRWLTMDYRQAPVTYMTPTIGNEAFSNKSKSMVLTGYDGSSPDHYVDADGNLVDNMDMTWNQCGRSDMAYRDLWCKTYTDMKPMELNRFALPFMSDEYPYGSDGKLLTHDHRDSVSTQVDLSKYRFTKLADPVRSIRVVVPNNVHGGGIVDGVDTSNPALDMFHPNLWSMYWHMRPVTTAMEGCDIPTRFSRVGGSPSDPTLHNMYEFPCKVNMSDDPCYRIPWHEDMNYEWLMRGQVIIDGRIVDYVDRTEKRDIDAVYENYDWKTDSAMNASVPIDYTRSGFINIESDRTE